MAITFPVAGVGTSGLLTTPLTVVIPTVAVPFSGEGVMIQANRTGWIRHRWPTLNTSITSPTAVRIGA